MILLMEEILHQLIDSLSHDLQGFVHLRWCRISSINGRSEIATNFGISPATWDPATCPYIYIYILNVYIYIYIQNFQVPKDET